MVSKEYGGETSSVSRKEAKNTESNWERLGDDEPQVLLMLLLTMKEGLEILASILDAHLVEKETAPKGLIWGSLSNPNSNKKLDLLENGSIFKGVANGRNLHTIGHPSSSISLSNISITRSSFLPLSVSNLS